MANLPVWDCTGAVCLCLTEILGELLGKPVKGDYNFSSCTSISANESS